MNEHFVCIKVDREERPDVDAIYMDATQALTGHGGWPMTCFLTPDGDPFYCGTYYPKRPSQGMPAFRQVLAAVSEAWDERRDELTNAGAEVVRLLGERAACRPSRRLRTPTCSRQAVACLRSDFDPLHGGFGGAPKFPPSAVLEFLMRQGSLGALEMVAGTCTAMARGGMYDQLAGGFARYSVDDAWVVPHFEKMLYDNAQLVRDLRALVARQRFAVGPAHRDRDRAVHARPISAHPRAGSLPRWTPTPTASKVRRTSGRAANCSTCSASTTRSGSRTCSS